MSARILMRKNSLGRAAKKAPVFNNERGVALFLMLWILALLSVIVGEFCHTMRAEVRMTGNFSYGTRAYYAAYAGIQKGIEELVKSRLKVPNRKYESGDQEEEPVAWRMNADIPMIPYGNEFFKVRLDNESGKVNINRAGAALLRVMLNTFDLDDGDRDVIVDSILDWRDPDHFHRLNGAEDDYYKDLPEPYESKDGDFDSIEEIRLVRGMTDEVFYGGLRDMITVVGFRSPVKKSKSYGRININAASSRMLASLPLMTADLVEEVENYRKEKDFISMGDVVSIIGQDVYQAVAPYITLALSPYYTIRSRGLAREKSVQEEISAVVQIMRSIPVQFRILSWKDFQ